MLAEVYFIPKENRITLAEVSKDNSTILNTDGVIRGLLWINAGNKNIEANKNLKKVKLNDGISFKAILPNTPIPPPNNAAVNIKKST